MKALDSKVENHPRHTHTAAEIHRRSNPPSNLAPANFCDAVSIDLQHSFNSDSLTFYGTEEAIAEAIGKQIKGWFLIYGGMGKWRFRL